MDAKVHVVGFYEVETNGNKKVSPWKDSDILEGDIILTIENQQVTNNADITKIIENKDTVELKLLRNNEYIYTNINVVTNKHGRKSIGLYVRDKILGVGTLTYIDPDTNTYGALGHSVANGENSGQLLLSSIRSIRKASPGTPGEKYATLSNNFIGSVTKNTEIGVFGQVERLTKGDNIKVQKAANVRTGKAQLFTVVNGDKKEYFDIEIIEVKRQSSASTKGIKIKITDQALIDSTGGIVQGMSGSPIVQNGYLVGALSHVVISSPTIGYAVFAQWMIEEGY